jgi:polysaccharide export outer membrane protein
MNHKYHLKSNFGRVIVFFLLVTSINSCVSNEKIIYMQKPLKNVPLYTEGAMTPTKAEEYLLQFNDVIDIQITTTSPELNSLFMMNSSSPNSNQAASQGIMNGGDVFFINGYTLDNLGEVELPLLGRISLLGLTVEAAKKVIETKLLNYVKDDEYFIRVRLGGIRFSTLGEFRLTGIHTILANQINIFQAIAQAGDLTEIAKRNELVVIRQYPEGTKSFRVNLNDERILESEFFYIRPNDLLYAEPMKIRELGTGTTFVQTFALAVSTLSAVLLVLNAVK